MSTERQSLALFTCYASVRQRVRATHGARMILWKVATFGCYVTKHLNYANSRPRLPLSDIVVEDRLWTLATDPVALIQSSRIKRFAPYGGSGTFWRLLEIYGALSGAIHCSRKIANSRISS